MHLPSVPRSHPFHLNLLISSLLLAHLLTTPYLTASAAIIRAPSSTSPCAAGITHTLELAIAYDSTFCALHFSRPDLASAYIQATVNAASAVYARDTCITLALVHLDPHCNPSTDPYLPLTANPPPSILPSELFITSFRDVWNASPARAAVRRDLVVLFTGADDGTISVGTAYLNSVCQNDAYAWVERGELDIFVHEVAHTLSATHTSSGLMADSSRPGDDIFFSDDSVQQIETYVDTYGEAGRPSKKEDASCLTRSAPVCDDSCPGACVAGNCIARYSAAAATRFVPCSPLRLRFRCVVEEDGRKFGTDCDPRAQVVRRDGPEGDVFCCERPRQEVVADVVSVLATYERMRFVNGTVSREMIPVNREKEILRGRTLMDADIVLDCGGLGEVGSTPQQGNAVEETASKKGRRVRKRKQ